MHRPWVESMNVFLILIRIISAVLAPIGAMILSYLILRYTRDDHGHSTGENQACLRCGQSRQGANGAFTFTERVSSPRARVAKNQPIFPDTNILGSESHFICDVCAKGYLHREILIQAGMVLCYPVYLLVILPLFGESGLASHFLVETSLVLLTIAGMAAIADLFLSVRQGERSLADVRDRVVIRVRKPRVGKQFSYFTRTESRHLDKRAL